VSCTKRKFTKRATVDDFARQYRERWPGDDMVVFHCFSCLVYHIGHDRMGERTYNRPQPPLTAAATLGEILKAKVKGASE
jgi:hypothetical protein